MHKSRWIKNRTCGIYLDVIYLHHIQNADASYVCRTLKFRAVQFRNSAASQETADVSWSEIHSRSAEIFGFLMRKQQDMRYM